MPAGWIGMLRVRRRGAWSAEVRGSNLTPRSDRARCSSGLCWSSSESDSAFSCLLAWPCARGFLFLTTRYRGILRCYERQVSSKLSPFVRFRETTGERPWPCRCPSEAPLLGRNLSSNRGRAVRHGRTPLCFWGTCSGYSSRVVVLRHL